MTYASAVLADEPWGFWRAAGETAATVTDLSPNNRSLTNTSGNAPAVVAADGIFAGAKAFDFVTASGYLSSVTTYAQPTTVTYGCWAKFTTNPTNTVMLASFGGSGVYGPTSALLFTAAGNVEMNIFAGGGAGIATTTPPTKDVWHHIVGSVGPAGAKIRIDGVTVASSGTTAAQSFTSGVFAIGSGPWVGATTARGPVQVAEVATWRSQLSDAQTDAHYAAAVPVETYASAVLADSPMAYYRMNEASGTAMLDASGNGRDGTYSGPALGAPPVVEDGTNSVTFDGTNDRATVAYSSWMSGPFSAFSVEAWVRPSSVSGGTDLIVDRTNLGSTTSGNSNYQFYLKRISGETYGVLMRVGGVQVDVVGAPTGLAVVGKAAHLVATYDGSKVRMYVNGTLVNSVNATGDLASGGTLPLNIGSFADTYAFPGQIDDVALYPSALTEAQVAKHYQIGTNALLLTSDSAFAKASSQTLVEGAVVQRKHWDAAFITQENVGLHTVENRDASAIAMENVGDYVADYDFVDVEVSGWGSTIAQVRSERLIYQAAEAAFASDTNTTE